MSDEITLSCSISATKNGITQKAVETATTFSMTGSKLSSFQQTIGTSEEALSLGGLVSATDTPGYCFIKNLDSTNYVEIRPGTGAADCLKLKPGEFCVFRFAAVQNDGTTPLVPYAIANTASVDIQVLLIED